MPLCEVDVFVTTSVIDVDVKIDGVAQAMTFDRAVGTTQSVYTVTLDTCPFDTSNRSGVFILHLKGGGTQQVTLSYNTSTSGGGVYYFDALTAVGPPPPPTPSPQPNPQPGDGQPVGQPGNIVCNPEWQVLTGAVGLLVVGIGIGSFLSRRR